MALRVPYVTINLELDGKKFVVAPKQIQKDPIKPIYKHVDLVVLNDKEQKERLELASKAEELAAVATEELVEQPKKTRGRKPKPVEPVDPNVDNRTDRQKARDRKAKEKALLQEFNAQKLGSEEQQELRRARLKHLIKMGKSRGYLTHGEINDVMSCLLYTSDAADD